MSDLLADIDVIIPVFNGEDYIEEAVYSVLNQSLKPNHIIIVNDGSIDGTAEILEKLSLKHSNIQILHSPHQGVSATRNIGIKASSTPFLAFLDADDLWEPNKLKLQREVYKTTDKNIGLVHSSYVLVNKDGTQSNSKIVVPPKTRGKIFHQLLFEQYVLSGSASSVLIRRSYLDKVGYFDESLYFGEDWDLWIRLASICEIDFTPEPVVKIRLHEKSTQRENTKQKLMNFAIQNLIVYDKWQPEIHANSGFKKKLKHRIVNDIFPTFIRPIRLSNANKFYNLLQSNRTIGMQLYTSRLDYWVIVLQVISKKIIKKLHSSTQRKQS